MERGQSRDDALILPVAHQRLPRPRPSAPWERPGASPDGRRAALLFACAEQTEPGRLSIHRLASTRAYLARNTQEYQAMQAELASLRAELGEAVPAGPALIVMVQGNCQPSGI